MEYVVRGRCSVKLQKRGHRLEPGGIFSYGPGVRQDIVADPANPPVKYFVDFCGSKSREILRLCRLPPGGVSQVFPPNEIQNLFDELIHCGQRGSPGSAGLCVKLLGMPGLENCRITRAAGRRRNPCPSRPTNNAGSILKENSNGSRRCGRLRRNATLTPPTFAGCFNATTTKAHINF